MVALHKDSDSFYDSQWENSYYLSRQGLYATFPHANDPRDSFQTWQAVFRTPVYRGEVIVRHGYRLKRLLPLDSEREYSYDLDDIEPSSRSQCLWCGSVGKTSSLLRRRHPTHCEVHEARDLDLWFKRRLPVK